MIDITYDSSAFYSEYDRYEQNVYVMNDTLNIDFRGIDNGIYFGYNFVKEEEQWMLIEKYDYSD